MQSVYAFVASPIYEGSDPNGIRTRVTAVKGRCPRPLDDRVGERQISRRRHSLQARNVGRGLGVRTAARSRPSTFRLRGLSKSFQSTPLFAQLLPDAVEG